nr:PDZ domain-containing protein [Alphaproteobacteria bacterium]
FNLLTTAINGKSFPPSWTESRKYTKTPSMSVGITYKRLDDKLKVMSVLLNSPAFLSGMQQEDIIVKINNRDIKELSNEQIDALFLGTTDGFVKLKVKKWGMANFHTKILRRTSLKTSPVDVVIDQKTLFLIIHNFDNRTPEWIASIFKNELTEDIENIVIDLRGTIGNEISMLKSMNLLLPKMNAGYIQYKTVKKKFSLSGESLVGQRKVIGVVDNNTEGIAKWAGRLIQSKGFLVGTTVDTSGQIFKSLELTDGTTVTIPIGEIFDFNNNSLKNNHIFPIICLRTIEGYTDLNVMLQNIKNNTFVFPDSKLESDKLKNACGNLALNDERTHFYRNVIIQLFKPEVFNEIKSQQKNILNF